MKSIQFQKLSKKLLPYAILCGLIILFTYGLPLTGSDLTFRAELGEGGPSAWLDATGKSGGNYISAFLGGILVDIPFLRHMIIAAMLSAAMITLLSYCGAEHSYAYYVVLFLGLAANKVIFAHTFSWTLGATAVLIPASLTVMYLFTVVDLFVYKGRKKSWKIPFLFLSGFVSQLFSEGIGSAILVLSLACLFMLTRKHGLSWHLAAHSLGCLLGCTLSLLVPGGEDQLSSSFYVMIDQFTLALDQLFVENLLVIGLMTLAMLLLIQPIRSERSKNCNKTLLLLLIPVGLFAILSVIDTSLRAFAVVYRYLTIVKLAAVLAYSYGILRTVQHYVSKDRVIFSVQYSLLAVWSFILVFSVVGTAQSNMLYIPHVCLTAMTVIISLYAFRRYSRLEKALRKPLMIVAIAGVLALSFVTICNSSYCDALDTHVRESLAEGKVDLVLPEAPYEDRFVPADYSQLSEYYDFSSYGTVEISYVPFGQWDWNTYYEAHNVPVIEEYDEDAEETEDWASEFEEDK